MTNFTKIFITILAIAMISTWVGFVFPASKERSKAPSEAERVDRRIDKLTMVIAEKEENGYDIAKAEGLLLEAIELFEKGKYEESMEMMDKVERALGLEPMRFERFEQGERSPFRPGMGMGRQPEPRELSDKEKQEIKNVVKELVKEANNLIAKGEYEGAFEVVTELQHNLARLTGRFAPMPPMQMGPRPEGDNMPRFGPGGHGGPGGPMGPGEGKGFRGQGRGEGPGPGREFGMGPGKGDQMRVRERDPEKHFNMLREQGEEGFDKAVKFFDNIVSKMKEHECKVDEKAVQKYDEALKLRKQNKLDAAFDSLHDAFMILREHMKKAGVDPGVGDVRDKPKMGSKNKFDKGRAEKELSKEEKAKIESELKSLKEVASKYVEKYGEDDFIVGCFKKFKEIESGVRRGEIKIEKALEMIKGLRKEIEKKSGESSKEKKK